MKLTSKQNNAVYYLKDDKTTEIVYGGAAGGGKSALGCLWLMEGCQKYSGSRWMMGRSKLKTLKETTLNTFFELSGKLGIRDQFTYNSQSGVIKWCNDSEILLKDLFLYPSDPEFDSLGSLELTGAFIDEISQVVYKAWQITKSRIRYRLKDFGLIPKILGTCNPSKGWPYREFYKQSVNGQLSSGRAFIRSLPTDNPHLPASYMDSLLTLDEQSKQRLYYGNWEYDDDPTTLIPYQHIEAMWSNIYAKTGTRYITSDIARYGSDKAITLVWDGWQVIDYVVLDISKTTDIENVINALRVKHEVMLNNIIVDDDGVGGGVTDHLGCVGFVNNSKPNNESYSNLKSECGYKLSQVFTNIWFRAEMASSSMEQVEQELEQLKTWDSDKDGKLKIIPKEKIKENIGRSPDWLDNFIMRMHPEVKGQVSTDTVINQSSHRL